MGGPGDDSPDRQSRIESLSGVLEYKLELPPLSRRSVVVLSLLAPHRGA